jgi:hypothetical protein
MEPEKVQDVLDKLAKAFEGYDPEKGMYAMTFFDTVLY